jgi:hypothetical protein
MRRVMVWVLLLEGLASAGIQMLAIRQSVGHVGSSVLSASIVIAAFLLALVLGYTRGGRKQVDHRPLLIKNLSNSFRMDLTIRSSLSKCVTDIIQGYGLREANILYFCHQPTDRLLLPECAESPVLLVRGWIAREA